MTKIRLLVLAVVLLLVGCELTGADETVRFPGDPRVLQGEWLLEPLVEPGLAPVMPGFIGASLVLDAEYIDRDWRFRMYSVSGRYLDGNQDLPVVGAVNGGESHLYVLNEASAQWSRTGPLTIWLNVNAANGEGVLYQLSLSAPDPALPGYEGFLREANTGREGQPVRLIRAAFVSGPGSVNLN